MIQFESRLWPSARTVTIRARRFGGGAPPGWGALATLGRLGGLLKLWLAERRGGRAPAAEVYKGLADIKAGIDPLAEKAAAS